MSQISSDVLELSPLTNTSKRSTAERPAPREKAAETKAPNVIKCDGLILDQEQKTLQSNGFKIKLSEQLMNVCAAMATQPDKIWTSEDLQAALAEQGIQSNEQTLKNSVASIKRKLMKLGADQFEQQAIVNIFGQGYMFASRLHKVSAIATNEDDKARLEQVYATHKTTNNKKLDITINYGLIGQIRAAKKEALDFAGQAPDENDQPKAKPIELKENFKNERFGHFHISDKGRLSYQRVVHKKALAGFYGNEKKLLHTLFNNAVQNDNRPVSLKEIADIHFGQTKKFSKAKQIDLIHITLVSLIGKLKDATLGMELEKLIEHTPLDTPDGRTTVRLNPGYQPRVH